MTSHVVPAGALPRVLALSGAAAVAAMGAESVPAQTAPEQSAQAAIQTVVVTGSRIQRTDTETPSPVQIITSQDLQQSGFTSTQQVLNNLTANGQGTLSQSFSGAFASGAAGVALRGLNVGYTLVLIDGHRTAPYPIGDDGQRSFVDISNIPFDAVDRIEVLKDGASAVYGSDAIAGVVNIILKKTYEGATATADAGTSIHGDGNMGHVAATWGIGSLANDGHNFYISAEWRKQQEIRFEDRGGVFSNFDYTGSGGINSTNGVPNINNGGLPGSNASPGSLTGYLTDANGNIQGFFPGCNLTKLNAGQCSFPDSWDQIQPPTTNVNVVVHFTQNFSHDWQLGLQGTYFQSKSEQTNYPQSTFPGGTQLTAVGPSIPPTLEPPVGPTTIPTTNPSYPAGVVIPGGGPAILYYTFLNDIGPQITDTNAQTYRAIAELNGSVGRWDLNVSAGYTEVRLLVTNTGYLNPSALQSALDSTTDPFLVGQQNSATVLNEIAPRMEVTDTSKLSFGHVGASGRLFDLPGGPFSLGLGAEYIDHQQDAQAPALIAEGQIYNGNNNFTVGSQQVASAYAEFVAPVVKQLEIDGAVRYDHYNISGGRASPKIGFKWTPVQQFALRGTASRGFRAPGPAENGNAGQTFFAANVADPILCPNSSNPTAAGNFVGQCNVAYPSLQSTNADLKAETSKSATAGFIFQPVRDFSSTFDYYVIKIDNQIISGGSTTTVRSTNLTPIPQYQANGTVQNVAPPVGKIAYVSIGYINANSTKTDGFDLDLDYHHDFDGGWRFKSEAMWTFIHKFDITIDGVTYSLAGTHGPFLFSGDTGNPRSRVAWSNTLAKGPVSVTATVNYISSFNVTDPSSIGFIGADQSTCLSALQTSGAGIITAYTNLLLAGTIPDQRMCTVPHFTTVDLYARWDVTSNLSLHGAVQNLFNAKAPLDWETYGGALGVVPWNPSLHLQGAIGAFFSLGATYNF